MIKLTCISRFYCLNLQNNFKESIMRTILICIQFFFLTFFTYGQVTPCNLTGGGVYIDNNSNPRMMNASVNGMSMYNYFWIDTNGAVISTSNQIPFYTQWCVTIIDEV